MQKDDVIDRQAAIEKFAMTAPQMSVIRIYEAVEILESMPTIQPERKKGEWSDGYRWQRCSLCKQTGKKSWNYCPNCGARMKGEI